MKADWRGGCGQRQSVFVTHHPAGSCVTHDNPIQGRNWYIDVAPFDYVVSGNNPSITSLLLTLRIGIEIVYNELENTLCIVANGKCGPPRVPQWPVHSCLVEDVGMSSIHIPSFAQWNLNAFAKLAVINQFASNAQFTMEYFQ